MATVSGKFVGEREPAWQAIIDRWMFVGMAAFITVTVLVGFVPDSLMKLDQLAENRRPPLPAMMHVHAVLMGSWMLLLLTQTTLMATGRKAMHMQLGILGMFLAPTLVLVGMALVPINAQAYVDWIATAPVDLQAKADAQMQRSANIMLIQFRTGITFLALVWIALRARRLDSATHKRLLILATTVPLSAAFNRMTWLPTSMPDSPISGDLWQLVLIAPMFLWDWYRRGAVQRAYLVWAAWFVPGLIIINLAWNTPAWQAFARGVLYG
jgi:hypothetical protein